MENSPAIGGYTGAQNDTSRHWPTSTLLLRNPEFLVLFPIKKRTKILLFWALVLSTLQYVYETWTLYRRSSKQTPMNSLHLLGRPHRSATRSSLEYFSSASACRLMWRDVFRKLRRAAILTLINFMLFLQIWRIFQRSLLYFGYKSHYEFWLSHSDVRSKRV